MSDIDPGFAFMSPNFVLTNTETGKAFFEMKRKIKYRRSEVKQT